MNNPTEEELLARVSVGPRVMQWQVDEAIVTTYYHVPPGTTLTLCVLTLANGFTVTGESACASPANFDAEVGRHFALEDAKRKLWPLMGYALREQLAAAARAAG